MAVNRINHQYYLLSFHDTAASRKQEYQLRHELDRMTRLLHHLPGLFYLFDRHGQFLHWNRHFEAVSGYSPDQIAAAHPLDFIPEEQQGMVLDITRRVFMTGTAASEWSLLTRNQIRIPYLFNQIRYRMEDRECLMSVGIDISERKLHEQDVLRQAHFDTLTGLPNRNLLYDRFSRCLSVAQRYERQLAILFIDLDLFKEVNDSYGHPTGDQVLYNTARRILCCLRESDTVARVGGDEFVILLPEISGLEEACVVTAQSHAGHGFYDLHFIQHRDSPLPPSRHHRRKFGQCRRSSHVPIQKTGQEPLLRSSRLTGRTPIGCPLAQTIKPDGLPAAATRLTGPVVDVQGLAEIARRSGSVDKIPEGRTTHRDGRFQHLTDGLGQSVISGRRQVTGSTVRQHTGPEQGFVGIDITDSHHLPTVHDKAFDGRGSAS
jgi:PAS domain S-box-containing protein